MKSLLPPNATPLERAIEQLIMRSFYDRPRLISGAKFNPALRKAVHSDLVYEWSLAPLEPFVPADQILDQGVQWSRIKGTVAAVEQALEWVGLNASTVEETGPTSKFNRLQLDSGCIPTAAQITNARELAKLSLPARAVFNRIFHGYDRRVLCWSTGTFSNQHLSDDSGVWIDSGMKLSFGRKFTTQSDINAETKSSATLSVTRLHSSHLLPSTSLRYGTAKFGDKPHKQNSKIMHGRLHTMHTNTPLHNPQKLSHRKIARAAVVLSESVFGEINTRFGGYAVTSDHVLKWSDPQSKLSGFDTGRKNFPLEEVFSRSHTSHAIHSDFTGQKNLSRQHATRSEHNDTSRMSHGLRWSDKPLGRQPPTARTRTHTSRCGSGIGERASRYGWSGRWDSRKWCGDMSLTHSTGS